MPKTKASHNRSKLVHITGFNDPRFPWPSIFGSMLETHRLAKRFVETTSRKWPETIPEWLEEAYHWGFPDADPNIVNPTAIYRWVMAKAAGGAGPTGEKITMRVALERFKVSRATLKRAKLHDYRAPNAPSNAERVFSERELASRYERR